MYTLTPSRTETVALKLNSIANKTVFNTLEINNDNIIHYIIYQNLNDTKHNIPRYYEGEKIELSMRQVVAVNKRIRRIITLQTYFPEIK